MVGGGPETKAILHVTRGSASQPSFVYDIAETVGAFVNTQTAGFAMTGSAKWPMVAASGGKEPLRAEMVALTEGSDHQVYSDSSWGIPAIYLNDWLERRAAAMRRKDANVLRFADWYERELQGSIDAFFGARKPPPALSKGVFKRNPKIKGTMGAFGYDYFDDHYPKHAEIRLAGGRRYEALNLVDGRRTAAEIAGVLSAIYGPTPVADVEQYLAALASIEVVVP